MPVLARARQLLRKTRVKGKSRHRMRNANTGVIVYASNNRLSFFYLHRYSLCNDCLGVLVPKVEHDAPKLTDFGDNIMLQIIDFDHVYDFGLIQSKIIVI
jgi:hypothetical protein